MEKAAIWAVSSSFWASVFALLAVSLFWKWWSSVLGRAVITLDICILLATGPTVLGIEFGVPVDNHIGQWEAIASFFAIAAMIVWKVWVLFRIQAGPDNDVLSSRQALAQLWWGVTHPIDVLRGRWLRPPSAPIK